MSGNFSQPDFAIFGKMEQKILINEKPSALGTEHFGKDSSERTLLHFQVHVLFESFMCFIYSN